MTLDEAKKQIKNPKNRFDKDIVAICTVLDDLISSKTAPKKVEAPKEEKMSLKTKRPKKND